MNSLGHDDGAPKSGILTVIRKNLKRETMGSSGAALIAILKSKGGSEGKAGTLSAKRWLRTAKGHRVTEGDGRECNYPPLTNGDLPTVSKKEEAQLVINTFCRVQVR